MDSIASFTIETEGKNIVIHVSMQHGDVYVMPSSCHNEKGPSASILYHQYHSLLHPYSNCMFSVTEVFRLLDQDPFKKLAKAVSMAY